MSGDWKQEQAESHQVQPAGLYQKPLSAGGCAMISFPIPLNICKGCSLIAQHVIFNSLLPINSTLAVLTSGKCASHNCQNTDHFPSRGFWVYILRVQPHTYRHFSCNLESLLSADKVYTNTGRPSSHLVRPTYYLKHNAIHQKSFGSACGPRRQSSQVPAALLRMRKLKSEKPESTSGGQRKWRSTSKAVCTFLLTCYRAPCASASRRIQLCFLLSMSNDNRNEVIVS